MLWFTRPIHYKSPSEKLGTLLSFSILLNFVLSLHDQLLGYPLYYTYAVKAKNFNGNLLLELSALPLSPCHAMKSVWYVAHLYTESWEAFGVIKKTPVNATPVIIINPYPTAFPYGNGMVLHFYQQQESSTTKTVHKVINKGLKTYV